MMEATYFEYEVEHCESEEVEAAHDDVEDATDEKIEIQRNLVHLVQQVPPLFNNKLKEYCGKHFDKMRGWESVGASMIPTMSGADAKKEFYKIRQRFGKELRKQRTWLRGKSGQQDKGPFVSSWPLFNNCLYLADIITPKKTVSSYTSVPRPRMNTVSRPSPSPSPNSLTSPTRTITSRRPSLTPSPGVSRSTPSPSTSSMWSSDGDMFINDVDCGEGTSEFVTPRPMTPASQQVLNAMQKAAASVKRSAPEPDGFAKKRRKQDDEFMKSMMLQTKTLADAAKQVGQSIASVAPPSQAPGEPENPLLGTIKIALQDVPATKKIQCLMDVLNLITTKYSDKPSE